MQRERELVKTLQKIKLPDKETGFITGTLIMPEQIDHEIPAVIFIHGMTSSEAGYLGLAEKIAGRGLVCLTINLRGHGASSGQFSSLTINDLVGDGFTAYDYLVSLSMVDSERIGICGSSLGAAIALIVARERQIKSLVLRAPAVYTSKMMKMKLSKIMECEKSIFFDIKNPFAISAVKSIAGFSGDLLIVVSGRDEVIPWDIPKTIFIRASSSREKNLVVIPEAGHALKNRDWVDRFYALTESWMSNHLL